MAPKPLSPAEAAERWQALQDWLYAQHEEHIAAWQQVNKDLGSLRYDDPKVTKMYQVIETHRVATDMITAALAKMRELET